MSKILIVDDDKVFLEEISELLEQNGYVAASVSEIDKDIVKKIKQKKPDLILLDLKLGKISGFNVALLLSHDNEVRDIPIISISGYYRKDECEKIAPACKIVKTLVKPVNPDNLLSAIKEVLVQHRRK